MKHRNRSSKSAITILLVLLGFIGAFVGPTHQASAVESRLIRLCHTSTTSASNQVIRGFTGDGVRHVLRVGECRTFDDSGYGLRVEFHTSAVDSWRSAIAGSGKWSACHPVLQQDSSTYYHNPPDSARGQTYKINTWTGTAYC